MSDHEKSLSDEIRFHRLVGDDEPLAVDWRRLAKRLAGQLEVLAKRLSGAPGTTNADEERVARAALALKEFRTACAEIDDE